MKCLVCGIILFQTILFTTDENILEAVSKNDDAYEGDMLDDTEPADVPFERPSTADGGSDDVSSLQCYYLYLIQKTLPLYHKNRLFIVLYLNTC